METRRGEHLSFDFHRYANNHLIFTKKKFKQVYVEYYHLSPIMDSFSLVCKEERQSGDVRPLLGSSVEVVFGFDLIDTTLLVEAFHFHTMYFHTMYFHTMYFHP